MWVEPILPSTRKEARLAYDIELKITKGNFKRSIFLQHKVSTFVSNRKWNNSEMYDCHNGPFFWFHVRNTQGSKQHNRLVALAHRWNTAFYCAPLFHREWELQSLFAKKQVVDNSRIFDPVEMGYIGPLEQHQVSYDPLGRNGFFHSEARKLEKIGKLPELLKITKMEIDEEYFRRLFDSVVSISTEYGPKRVTVPKPLQEFGYALRASYLLKRHFGVSWILV